MEYRHPGEVGYICVQMANEPLEEAVPQLFKAVVNVFSVHKRL